MARIGVHSVPTQFRFRLPAPSSSAPSFGVRFVLRSVFCFLYYVVEVSI